MIEHLFDEGLVNAQQGSADAKPEWRSERRTVEAIKDIRRTALATAQRAERQRNKDEREVQAAHFSRVV